jgi:hypothetical protein
MNAARQLVLSAISVTIGAPEVVQIQISATPIVLMTRNQSLQLEAIATGACGNVISRGLQYTWLISQGSTALPWLTSISKDKRIFQLSPFSLNSSRTYSLRVAGAAVISSPVFIQVGRGEVLAVLSGGSQTVSQSNSVVLDASQSINYDAAATGSGLVYFWSCVDISAGNFGGSCRTLDGTPAGSTWKVGFRSVCVWRVCAPDQDVS